MSTVTFEVYNGEFYVEFSVETADPSALVAALSSLSNVRALNY